MWWQCKYSFPPKNFFHIIFAYHLGFVLFLFYRISKFNILSSIYKLKCHENYHVNLGSNYYSLRPWWSRIDSMQIFDSEELQQTAVKILKAVLREQTISFFHIGWYQYGPINTIFLLADTDKIPIYNFSYWPTPIPKLI